MTDSIKSWIEERRAIHAAATDGPWELIGGGEYVAPAGILVASDDGGVSASDAAAIVDAHNMFPRALDALSAVLELHKPVSRYTAYGYEEFSFMSIKDAHDFIGEPVELDEFKLCVECMRVEDGAADNAREIGYEASLYPCPTVRAIEGAIND